LDRTHGEDHLRVWSVRWAPKEAPLVVAPQRLTAMQGHVDEWRRTIAEQSDGLRLLLARVGVLNDVGLTGYRQRGGLSCFVYRFSIYELCLDARARLVLGFDRRPGIHRRWDLTDAPYATPDRLTPEALAEWRRVIPGNRREVERIRGRLVSALRASGPLDGPRLSRVRRARRFLYFSYRSGRREDGYVLGWLDGALVYARDERRGATWNLKPLPERAPVHVDPAVLRRIARTFRG
jgi:hypothetical protein